MRILVSGSFGYIGSLLCKALNNLGHDIKEFDIKTIPSNDIRNITNLEHVLLKNSIQTVIHLAAIRSIDQCESRVFDCIDVNLVASVAIYNLCQKYGIKFIFASTQATKNATNNYALCKLLAEQNMPNATILRLSNVVGCYEEVKELNQGGLTDNLILSIKNKQQLVLYGNCKRNFVFIDDVVHSFLNALNTKAGIYDCVGKINCSVIEWVSAFEKYFNYSIDVIYKPKKPYDAEDLSVNSVFDKQYFKKIVNSYGVIK